MQKSKKFRRSLAAVLTAASISLGAVTMNAGAILKIVDSPSPGCSSGNGIWMVQVYGGSGETLTNYNIDYLSTAYIDVVVKVDEGSRDSFDGTFGGSITTSCGNGGEDNPHNWVSNEFWGIKDEELGIETLADDKDVMFEKVGDYTYKGRVTINEENCFLEGSTYVQIAMQEWGGFETEYEVVSCTLLDESENVIIAFDGKGDVIAITQEPLPEYNAYIQWQNGCYSFRNAWNETTYGLGTKYFDGAVVWGNSDLGAETFPEYSDKYDEEIGGFLLDATYGDAEICGDGVYTVTMEDFDWSVDSSNSFNMLCVSTSIPNDAGAQFSNVKVYIDGNEVISIEEPVVYDDEYYTINAINVWDKLVEAYIGAYPTSDVKIQFEVDGLGEVIKIEPKPEVTAVAGNGQVTLSWNEVIGATNYMVYTYKNGEYAPLGKTTSTSYTAKNLTNGTEYGFLVRAYVNNAWSAFTVNDVVYATPVAPAIASPRPNVFPNDSKVTLTWDAIDGATTYLLYTYMDGVYTPLKRTTGTVYTVRNLTNGTKYGFLVRALVNGTWTSFTVNDVVYATPVAPVTSPKPTVYPNDSKVTLTWDAIDGATTYLLYTYKDGVYTPLKRTTGTVYTVRNLTNGKKYGFLVRALVNGTWTPFTVNDVVYATPVAPVTSPKPNVYPADGKITLTWDAVDGATTYLLYSYKNGVYTPMQRTAGTVYTVRNLTNGTEYGFLLRALVNGAWTPFTVNDVVYATPNPKA